MSRMEIRTTSKETVMDWVTFCDLTPAMIMEFVTLSGKRRAREIEEHSQPQRKHYTPVRVMGK